MEEVVIKKYKANDGQLYDTKEEAIDVDNYIILLKFVDDNNEENYEGEYIVPQIATFINKNREDLMKILLSIRNKYNKEQ